jgi:hypothetical protein
MQCHWAFPAPFNYLAPRRFDGNWGLSHCRPWPAELTKDSISLSAISVLGTFEKTFWYLYISDQDAAIHLLSSFAHQLVIDKMMVLLGSFAAQFAWISTMTALIQEKPEVDIFLNQSILWRKTQNVDQDMWRLCSYYTREVAIMVSVPCRQKPSELKDAMTSFQHKIHGI